MAQGAIQDVAGVVVGHADRCGDGWLTGVTVVIPPPGTVGGVDVRGGGPGTHETDALDPRTLVPTVDAVVLAGGSAFGLIAAHGAQRWLEENGRGFEAAPGVIVPIVPAAVIFDIGRGGDPAARPTESMGYEAAAAASPGVRRGNVGAGMGAVIAGGQYKGGIGTASATAGGVTIGALAVVNALGAPVVAASDLAADGAPDPATPIPGLNTTLVVLATDAALDPAQASRLATVGHDGLARALNPVHTLADGDTVFALATGAVEITGGVPELVTLHATAADVVRRAILDAVLAASDVTTPAGTWPGFPARALRLASHAVASDA